MSSHPYLGSGEAFDSPGDAGEGDQGRGGDDDPAAVLFLVLDPEGRGYGQTDDGQLAEFDAHIEAEQGAADGAFGDTLINEALGKAEPVDQAKGRNQPQSPLAEFLLPQVLQADPSDARGDHQITWRTST